MKVQMWKQGNHRLVVPYIAQVLVRFDPKEKLVFAQEGHLSTVVYEPFPAATQGLNDLEAYFRLCLSLELRIEEVRRIDGMDGVRKFLANAGWELEG